MSNIGVISIVLGRRSLGQYTGFEDRVLGSLDVDELNIFRSFRGGSLASSSKFCDDSATAVLCFHVR
ncbi:hypothetical protein LTR67_010767 [Exophiala xenobiotica]